MAEFLAALVIALIVGGVFAALGARGPWGGVFWFFLILFFATWAIALWVRPVGPAYWGVYWVIFLAVAIGVALLLAAATPGLSAGATGRPPEEAPPGAAGDRVPDETRTERTLSKTAAGIGIAFWVLLLFFLIAVILGYVFV